MTLAARVGVIRRAGVVYRPLRERPMTQLVMVWCKDAPMPVLREFLQEVRRMGDRGIRARRYPHPKRSQNLHARGMVEKLQR
jgi:hypothetical protein